MNGFEQERRSLLFGVSGFGIHMLQPISESRVQPHGYVLRPIEGDHLAHFCYHGNAFIKVVSATGSGNVAMPFVCRLVRSSGLAAGRTFLLMAQRGVQA